MSGITQAMFSQRMPELSYVGLTVSATSATTYTFSNVNIGLPRAGRTVLVVVASSAGAAVVNSVTIGGVTATLSASSSGATSIAFAALNNETLSSASIVVTHSASKTVGCAIAVYNLLNFGSTTALSSSIPAGTSSVTSMSTGNLTSVPNGCVIGVLVKLSNSDSNTWTGVNENSSTSYGSYTVYFASSMNSSSSSTYVVSSSWATAANARIGAATYS